MESSLSGSLRCADCSTAKSLALVCESHGENAHTPVPSDEKERGTPAASLAPDAPENTPPLDHERLDCFKVALEFVAMVPALTKTARPALRDQIERASSSIALTLAEGCARRTKRDRHHFFSIAQGSAMECAAAIDVLRVTGCLSPADATRAKHKLTRIVQMLVGLRRR